MEPNFWLKVFGVAFLISGAILASVGLGVLIYDTTKGRTPTGLVFLLTAMGLVLIDASTACTWVLLP